MGLQLEICVGTTEWLFARVKVFSGLVGQEVKLFGAGGLLVPRSHTWDLPRQLHPDADYLRSTLKLGTLPSRRC